MENERQMEGILKGCNILICDDSITTLKLISLFLENSGCAIFTALNGTEGLEICRKEKIHLVISDINMPEMDGFALFHALDEQNLDIPRLLITDADIDEFINMALEQDIGNILSKPIDKEELINLCYSLITGKGIFGLENYIKTKTINSFTIKSSPEIRKGITRIVEFGKSRNMPESRGNLLSIILDEMLSNALYHAHGYTKEKENRETVTLDGKDKVEVSYGIDEDHLAIGVTDYKGILTKKKILTSLLKTVEERKLIQQALMTGQDVTSRISNTGRGLQMIRLMSNKYYFNIKKKTMTQVVILVDTRETNNRKNPQKSAIKINEIY